MKKRSLVLQILMIALVVVAPVRSQSVPELEPELREDFKGCSRALYDALGTLDKKSVKRELENYLSAFEINALMKRRDKLIKLIDRQIKKKGESEILFNYTDPPKGLVIKYDDE